MLFHLNRNSIYVKFSINGTRYHFATGLTTKRWMAEGQRIHKDEDFAWEKNEKLERMERAIMQIIQKCKMDNTSPSPDFIKAHVRNIKQERAHRQDITFVADYIAEWMERKRNTKSNGYVRIFGTLERKIRHYQPMLTFRDISPDWWDGFVSWMLDGDDDWEPNLNNTVAGYVKRLKKICRDALKTGHEVNPYFDEFSFREVTHTPIWLDFVRHLPKLEKAELSESLSRVRDRFLFRCYTGIREGEMNRLLPQNFYQRGGKYFLKFFDTKGMKDKGIQLNDQAVMILQRYEFDLPKLSQQKENEWIKEVAKGAELTEMRQIVRYRGSKPVTKMIPLHECVTTHTARRSFARRWYENGGDLKKLQKYLGHSSIKTTEVYIGVEDDEVNDEMLRVI